MQSNMDVRDLRDQWKDMLYHKSYHGYTLYKQKISIALKIIVTHVTNQYGSSITLMCNLTWWTI